MRVARSTWGCDVSSCVRPGHYHVCRRSSLNGCLHTHTSMLARTHVHMHQRACTVRAPAGAAWEAEERLRELVGQIADLVPELPDADPMTQVSLSHDRASAGQAACAGPQCRKPARTWLATCACLRTRTAAHRAHAYAVPHVRSPGQTVKSMSGQKSCSCSSAEVQLPACFPVREALLCALWAPNTPPSALAPGRTQRVSPTSGSACRQPVPQCTQHSRGPERPILLPT